MIIFKTEEKIKQKIILYDFYGLNRVAYGAFDCSVTPLKIAPLTLPGFDKLFDIFAFDFALSH